jgi:hypothetical protein
MRVLQKVGLLLIFGLMISMSLFGADIPPVTPPADAAMGWKDIFFSSPAIVFYIAIVIYVFRTLQTHYHWDTERWEGMISQAFLFGEQFTGAETKLGKALEEFRKRFVETHGRPPSVQDITDATLDLARYAMKHKLAGLQGGADAGVSDSSASAT